MSDLSDLHTLCNYLQPWLLHQGNIPEIKKLALSLHL